MRRETAALNDYQTVMVCERGTSLVLVIQQEELTEGNGHIISPAKSFTISQREAAIKLRDLLNKTLEEVEAQ